MNERDFNILILAGIGAIGGMVSYLQTYMEEGRFSIKKLMAQMFISGFCGGIVADLFRNYVPDWTYAISGLSGVFGIYIIYFIFNFGLRVFGKQLGVPVKDLSIIHKTEDAGKSYPLMEDIDDGPHK